jgi:hypothetical protein
MRQDRNTIPKKTFKKWQNAVVVLIMLAVIGQFAGCGTTSSTEKASEITVGLSGTEYEVDMFAKSACRKFREFAREAGKGIFTISEMRAGYKDIYESARLSEVDGIGEMAALALAQLTNAEAGSNGGLHAGKFKIAVDTLSLICIEIGQGYL